MTANKSYFKAPQQALRSSWVQIAFSKPKACNVTKRSLSNRANAIVKTPKGMATLSSLTSSNQY